MGDDDKTSLFWFVIVGDLALVFLLLCVCMTCKWFKQKREIDVMNAIIADDVKGSEVEPVEGGKNYVAQNTVIVADNTSTVLLEEGDAVTFNYKKIVSNCIECEDIFGN